MSDGEKPERRGYLPADPRRNQTLAEIGLPNISLYRREDLMLLRNQAKRGMLPVETMLRLQESLALMIGDNSIKDRTQIAAFRALAPLWLGLMKFLKETHTDDEQSPSAATTVNQQININLPDNGRLPE